MRDSIKRSFVTANPSADGTGGTFTLRFSSGEPVFKGHFPGYAVVPGIFQVEITRMAAEMTTEKTLGIREVKKARFSSPLLPEQEIVLDLTLLENPDLSITASAKFAAAGKEAGQTVLVLCR